MLILFAFPVADSLASRQRAAAGSGGGARVTAVHWLWQGAGEALRRQGSCP